MRPRREQPLLLGGVLLEDVGLQGAAESMDVDALTLGGNDVAGEDPRRRAVDRHRYRHLVQRDAREQRLGVVQRRHRHAAPADLALAARVVGIQTHQGRHVERDREPRLPPFEQEPESLVRLGGRAIAGELTHRPQAPAIHRGVRAAREREHARQRLAGRRLVVHGIQRDAGTRGVIARFGRHVALMRSSHRARHARAPQRRRTGRRHATPAARRGRRRRPAPG